ncbi:alpha-1,3/1,6-mannosyltransferase ALG2 [Fimicolochytrium jonesii]|uniref:alpha-1,3/1,6-mannosyltransferase ALG2 n=1 Tax=Fimicolochytrium jonesii TaxID=1396493 RepID=UPI0022FF25D5|nr:alpha-1,3/1,6-mannosyltransferase ALG2 [Fimicolochytrium jonesii]KAI8825741.1 alpha-1,3/1,6-mannosyltransferase ALG2 [Fimicolochytrium jonesii]
MASNTLTPLRIAFIHPDLGIGGAERLVVDAAVGLQSHGHSVKVFTSHHDPSHCFQETRDSTLDVSVIGDWLPRSILGKAYILFAILRNLLLSASLLTAGLMGRENFDVLVVDQLSISVPLLRFSGAKILFYCHFPDKLLTKRESLLKTLYRLPVDMLEELTTKMADKIVVNSKFTANIFRHAFPNIKSEPDVVYPGIHLKSYRGEVDEKSEGVAELVSDKKTILSINRFERKKNIELAIHAFHALRSKEDAQFESLRLVIAGGYDSRVTENVEYLTELSSLAQGLNLSTHTYSTEARNIPPSTQVVFLPSFTESQRTHLLATSQVLLYTPSNEHFGIVPLEAMYASLPVIAVNSGGPLETVVEGVTGFLRDGDPEAFAEAITRIVKDGGVEGKRMGGMGRRRVEGTFSSEAFIDKLEAVIGEMLRSRNSEAEGTWQALMFRLLASAVVLAIVGWWFARYFSWP